VVCFLQSTSIDVERWALWQTVASDYGVYLKKYNDVSEHISANLNSVQDVGKVNVARASSGNAVVLVLIDATSHQVCDTPG